MTGIDPGQVVDPMTLAASFVDEFVATMVNLRIYAKGHPRVQGGIASLRQRLRELSEQANVDPVRLGIADELLVFQQRPLVGASLGASRLIAALKQWGAGGVELAAQASAAEIEALLQGLLARVQPGQDHGALNALLGEQNHHSVRLLPLYAERRPADSSGDIGGVRVGVQFYQAVIDLLQTVTVQVCRGGRIDFGPVQAQAEQVLQQLESHSEPMLGLARQDQFDAFTFGHSVRVAVLAVNFARALTDDRELLIRIGTAALLHDVGKALIPFELLHSPKPLSAEERETMNRHAELGAECLLDHQDADPLAVAAAFGHHQGPDGAGYPRTLHRAEVNMVTSIVKICDVYEALTAARPYKQPMSPIRAYRVMLAMGDKLDRRLLRRFIEVNGVYPVGQFVELDTGEVAVVRAQTAVPHAPIVAVLSSAGAGCTDPGAEPLFDLSQVECPQARTILGELTPDAAQRRLERHPSAVTR